MPSKRHTDKEVGPRLKELRKEFFPGKDSRAQMCKAAGISQASLSEYESGKSAPSTVTLRRILKATKYSARWLLTGEGPKHEGPQASHERPVAVLAATRPNNHLTVGEGGEHFGGLLAIPVMASQASAGAGRVGDDNTQGWGVIHRDWCPHPDRTEYVPVEGDSMEPTIPNGALVTVDRTMTDPRHLLGRVVCIGLAGGDVTIKRLHRTEREAFIGLPDNRMRPETTVMLGEGDRIIGTVMSVHAQVPALR